MHHYLDVSEVYPTCAEQNKRYKAVPGQAKKLESGVYAIDPDGPFGEPPFNVICKGTETVLVPTSKL